MIAWLICLLRGHKWVDNEGYYDALLCERCGAEERGEDE